MISQLQTSSTRAAPSNAWFISSLICKCMQWGPPESNQTIFSDRSPVVRVWSLVSSRWVSGLSTLCAHTHTKRGGSQHMRLKIWVWNYLKKSWVMMSPHWRHLRSRSGPGGGFFLGQFVKQIRARGVKGALCSSEIWIQTPNSSKDVVLSSCCCLKLQIWLLKLFCLNESLPIKLRGAPLNFYVPLIHLSCFILALRPDCIHQRGFFSCHI